MTAGAWTDLAWQRRFSMATWDAWAQEAIAHVFGATLRPGETNEHLVYVPELRDELEAERGESEPMATWDMADRLLIARLSLADARDTSCLLYTSPSPRD